MATLAHLLLENFERHIKATTSAYAKNSNRFVPYDPLHPNVPVGSGGARRFYVECIAGEEDTGATDADNREAWHLWRVIVKYPRTLPSNELVVMIRQDLHALKKTLRDTTTRVGDSASASTDVGLLRRMCGPYQIDRVTDPDAWLLIMSCRCLERESEQ